MAHNASNSPPTVPLTFRVGVVGHRPNRLGDADRDLLSSVIRDLLHKIQDCVAAFAAGHSGLYAGEAPRLVALSPCAEGSDRIFAAQAIALGYALHCPMPFAQAEYEQDFVAPQALEQDSVTTFRRLLGDAKAGPGLHIFELDGERTNNGAAYGQAGGVVLNQSDVLVAVWDGAAAAGTGGTVDTLKEALSYRIPVIWVNARRPHVWQVLREQSELACLRSTGRCAAVQSPPEALVGLVTEILDVPRGIRAGRHDSPKPDLREAYFAETMPRWNLAVLWKLFRDAVGADRFTLQALRLESVEAIADRDWPRTAPGVTGWVNGALGRHFAWADRMADYYADCYRSSFLFAFLGSVAAVFLAILPVWAGWDAQQNLPGLLVTAAIELGLLLGIIGLILWGNHRRWHERWMEYRVLAELIRELHFLIPLGGGRPFARLFAHLGGYGRPTESWMSWHARALERATGLPSARVDEAYVQTALVHLKTVVDGQTAFHETSHHRHHRLEHRLHWVGVSLFGLTAAVVAAHFVELAAGHSTGHENAHDGMGWMIVVAAFFPVVGAALAGINNQGEFARLAMRNEAMADRLQGCAQEIDDLSRRAGTLRLVDVVRLSMCVAQLMIDEVVDWRVIFLHRPLVPPV